MRLRPVAAVISAILIAGSIGSFVAQGLNLGIDFKGGTAMEVRTPGPRAAGRAARGGSGRIGGHDAQVQGFGRPDTGHRSASAPKAANTFVAAEQVKQKLAAKFPGMEFKPPVGRRPQGLRRADVRRLHGPGHRDGC